MFYNFFLQDILQCSSQDNSDINQYYVANINRFIFLQSSST